MIVFRHPRPWFALVAICLLSAPARGQARGPGGEELPYVPVETPNGATLAWTWEGEWKTFRLIVQEMVHEFAPGMKVKCWGYNGRTPGPTIEAIEGDKVRIYVKNELPEPTAVHWHGILLPCGQDGVSGLTQPPIGPGQTGVYEFLLRQSGTQMYHSHGDEMTQMGMGTMGFFIIHPKTPEVPRVDRDFALFLNEWFITPGTSTPDVNVMTDFNIFTFNSRAFPGTAPLVARTGERIRIRIANVGQESHPIHLHGVSFVVTGTDGGRIPESAWIPETTVVVFPGQTRTIEMVFDEPGDWATHCHRRHHPMNAMGHGIPNVLGVPQGGADGVEEKIRKLLPGYMAMGEEGMFYHSAHAEHMPGPSNTLPMMGGRGAFGDVGMGGMFTVIKIRNELPPYDTSAGYSGRPFLEDPGHYAFPEGTVMRLLEAPEADRAFSCPMHADVVSNVEGTCPECGMDLVPASPGKSGQAGYACPMHPEVTSDRPGRCPKCGMELRTRR